LQTCSTQGQWTNATNCTTNAPPQTCTCATACSCSGVCAPGQAQCDPGGNNYLQYCDGTGNWQDSFLCQYVCVAGQTACSGVCTPGAIQCNQGMPQQCSGSGQWVSCNSPACLMACADAGGCSGGGSPCLAPTACCPGLGCLDNGSGGGVCGNACGTTCCGAGAPCMGPDECCFPMVCASGGVSIGAPFAGSSGSGGGSGGGSGSSSGVVPPIDATSGGNCQLLGGPG
jgi:hypothetical protein